MPKIKLFAHFLQFSFRSQNKTHTQKRKPRTHTFSAIILTLLYKEMRHKLFRNEHYDQIEWKFVKRTHTIHTRTHYMVYNNTQGVCLPIKWHICVTKPNMKGMPTLTNKNNGKDDSEHYAPWWNGRTIGMKQKKNNIHKIGNYIKCSIYERIFRSSFVHIYIYEFIVGMGTTIARFYVRQSCWIINKHSYTQFNSHENKCFYDDYLGYVRRVSLRLWLDAYTK